MERPKAIDLFCGAGGMSLGFEQAGFDIVGSVEIDPIHAAVHKYNFPNTATICRDITELTGKEILERANLEAGSVDVVFGGPPCQGFSLIGKRLVDDPRNSLLGHFGRIVKEIEPKYFVMENVSGLTIGHSKQILNQFIYEMTESKYEVVSYRVLTAANYGVPQDRKRLFVYGYRKDVIAPNYPEPITEVRHKKGLQDTQGALLPLCPSVEDAIGDLPNIDEFDVLTKFDSIPYNVSPKSNYARILHGVSEDENDFSYPRVWHQNKLTNSLRTKHTSVSVKRFLCTDWGETESVSRFFKLHPEGICNTLRAGTDSKRGAYTSPRPIHPYHGRVISVREAARLHSFPDWFRLHVTKWHGFRQVGNSVPPLLARAVAGQIIKAMDVVPIKPGPINLGNENLLSLNMSAAADMFNVPRDVIGTRDRK
ncbi:DNA cytosine methyltransferase [Desmospora profundinema]|uniref:Cytosine-specific methyltransferase n=1 Tax=Desmospora profundinema TaxID=1571184 RepID=A0ABU1IS60_9BACL|nr:DNA cytosine methyltransferase [Desmospora profundinema]MDR6227630.1 DNA (cytosine-5)-methyltransferase 1 [Desmospora profundinema]